MVTVKQAAEQLGLSQEGVYRLIKKRVIFAERYEGRMLISQAEVERGRFRRRREQGRPKSIGPAKSGWKKYEQKK